MNNIKCKSILTKRHKNFKNINLCIGKHSLTEILHAGLTLWTSMLQRVNLIISFAKGQWKLLVSMKLRKVFKLFHYVLAIWPTKFPKRGTNEGKAVVTGKRINSGGGYGLEVPCEYHLRGDKFSIGGWNQNLIKKVLNSIDLREQCETSVYRKIYLTCFTLAEITFTLNTEFYY